MNLVRENINFERGKDPKAAMGVGDPWIIGLKSSRPGTALLCIIELYGDREMVPAKAPKNKEKDNWHEGQSWSTNYVREEFPFQSDEEFKNVKNLYRERMNRPWPGSMSLTRTDRFGIYKTTNFMWLLKDAYEKGAKHINPALNYVNFSSYGSRIGDHPFQPGDTYKLIFDIAKDMFMTEINR